MKEILPYIKMLTLIVSFIYLIGIFSSWELNPGTWDPLGRSFAALAIFSFFVIYICYKNDSRSD